ncbi:flagellar biosynthesis protein FlhB [Sulfurirhabdus autotrophica]|uniref:Flagellar biosynthetic protein FlhB n=1 Tax=Sulfurirhabdus autotrophica TaxID=1706046 RepID=A0A4R3YJ63_9PROT|nr:flagellar biosynthesis protein FlhB [Sulfurirhabdus autotrophica]TCV90743.1 flagellar biosynthetic protein FlhB [Sulfurirhabdus autotrophica]
MAEDSDLEKTEPASPRRIEEAREKGQIARSRELTTFAGLLASAGGLILMGPTLIDRLSAVMRHGLTLSREDIFNTTLMLTRLHQASQEILIAFLPFLLLMAVAAVASSIMLSGWMFSFQALTPDIKRLNLFKGMARMFSSHSLVELAKAVAKSALIGGVGAWFIWHNVDVMLSLLTIPLDEGMGQVIRLMGNTLLFVSGSMILIVAIDVPFQLWEHSKKLKMTKEEVRKEAKESEGDPQLKARIRSMQREMARRRMMSEVPKADVIVTNPTHYAVALRYQDKAMSAPQVVAKGAHLLAERIIELGKENRIPILRTPPLARALYRHAEMGEEIPSELYTAVAEVLAYIYQLRQYDTRGGAIPQAPGDLPVPENLDPGTEE